jgi:long-chain acyl-CoA synthetase
VRQLVGLDAVRSAISGAAPIQREVLEWFNAIGVPLSEIYGMSESTGPMTWDATDIRPGTVGRALPGSEVVIAADGEVVYRGGNVFQGYLNAPDKTADTLVDGWLHSGDIGELDEDGYLKIVDRKKELIITSGGKNISPANLEAALKGIELIGQACAIGDQRKYVTALLVLDPDLAPQWAKAQGINVTNLSDLARDPQVLAEIARAVDDVNKQFANVEHIKRFTVLGEEWLPDSDVLTPTSKIKRRGILARYSAEIDAMYD